MKRSAAAIGLGTAMAACGGAATAPTGAGTTTPSPSARFDYNGITHVSWWHDEYGYADATASRRDMAATGNNWAGLLLTWYMEGKTSTDIAPDALKTPTDDVLVQAIGELHGLGQKVMLKPHVDVKDGTWRGTINPADKARWFVSYGVFLRQYAALAEANGVEMLCIGTELATLSDGRYAAEWSALVADLRAIYHGPLTYAANANSPGDEYASVSFWPLLDLMGLDVYTPLTGKRDPTRAELVRGWTSNRYGQNMLAAFKNWQASHGKPVIFTEIGYRSADGTNLAPYDYQVEAPYDPAEQADCYEVAFEVWMPESAWMKGVFWWAWAVPAPGPADTDFTPRGKPAEDVLRSWQRR